MTDVLLTDRTDGVVTLTLNRPDSLNPLDRALKEALRDALTAVAADRSCRAASALSCAHKWLIVSREGSLADGRARAFSLSAFHSARASYVWPWASRVVA